MMYNVYIIYSISKDRYYVGHTEDLLKRVAEHCRNKNLGANDWVLKYSESFATRGEAMKREMEIKSKKRRSYLEGLIVSSDSQRHG